MGNKRTILSYFMVFIYVLSFAHGSLPHSSCENHQTKVLHHHQVDDTVNDTKESLDEACISNGIIHSFVHLIESLAHSQFAHDEPMVVEVIGSNFYFLDVGFEIQLKKPQIIFSSGTIMTEMWSCYSEFHLLHTPLRGPPSIV